VYVCVYVCMYVCMCVCVCVCVFVSVPVCLCVWIAGVFVQYTKLDTVSAACPRLEQLQYSKRGREREKGESHASTHRLTVKKPHGPGPWTTFLAPKIVNLAPKLSSTLRNRYIA